MSDVAPIFIGYFPKHTARPDAWFGETHVEEICSVSECISEGPEGWIEHWKHNEPWRCYDTEVLAQEVMGETACDLYAYKLYPKRFDGEAETDLAINAVLPPPAQADYEPLGYDIVTWSEECAFECSPLSCNGGWKKFTVNRHCLIGTLEAALEVARQIAREGNWEPGPYLVVEVHRNQE